MKEYFEDKFMEIQTDLIALCLEVTNSKVDKVYAYVSIEKKSKMFNAFFEREEKIVTLNQLGINRKTSMDFLKVGTANLNKIISLCEENEMKIPTEIKMYYDVKSGKYNADYKYEEICSDKTGISSGEVFMQWYNEMKK